MKTLRDLLYLDLGKATSLLSQIEGGLVKEIKEKDERVETKSGDAKLGLKILESGIERGSSDSAAIERIKVLHHELLETIEQWLFTNGFALDLSEVAVEQEKKISPEQFRELITHVSYIRAEGWTTIEDFSNLQEMAKNFSYLVEFINNCNKYALETNEAYTKLKQEIDEEKRQARKITDRNARAKALRPIENKESLLEKMIGEVTQIVAPDDWLLEGIQKWIEQFNPKQIHFRLKPFDGHDIEVISNLKREYFLDTDIDHLLFTYGLRPNIKLTLLGLITSVPLREENDTSTENADAQEILRGESEQFQLAFRNVFKAMGGFEKFSSFASYPNIKIYPIAVYRKIESFYDPKEIV